MNGTAPQRTFLGHPIGLYILFFTEMWERFSYYGMRALLILYMVNYFKWSQRDASGIYKWYTSLVYLTPLLGGYLADRYLGNKKAVLIGAALMAVGHFLMAFEQVEIFFAALIFLILGNGFFKPNMSTQVGRLYPPNDPRRDGAYTIFYMGINLGAFMSPLICGWLAANTVGRHHTGFTVAGIGMVLGLLVYVLGIRWVVELNQDGAAASHDPKVAVAGDPPISEAQAERTPSVAPLLNRLVPGVFVLVGGALVLGVVLLSVARLILWKMPAATWLKTLSLQDHLANNTLISLGIVAICAFIAAWILLRVHNAVRDRVLTIYILGIFVVFFWAAFEQAGNAMNLWADKTTDRYLTVPMPRPSLFPETRSVEAAPDESAAPVATGSGVSRWIAMWQLLPGKDSAADANKTWWQKFMGLWNPVPTEWFQSINALAIFVLAPLFAFLWTWLGKRGRDPSIATKMALGVVLMSLSFAVMIAAAGRENRPTSVDRVALPPQIPLNVASQLSFKEDGRLEPYHAGRLKYDAKAGRLEMTGVLPDLERDRIVRETAPDYFRQAVGELRTLTQQAEGDEFSVSVTLASTPPGFDLRYAGFDPKHVSFDAEERRLTVANLRLADKDVKALLVAAGDPDFRTAMDKLYLQSADFRVTAWWLFWFYILATLGELCLSPVGLSMVSKLAPAKFATMLMGLWLLTSFFGNFVAGAFGEKWGEWPPTEYFTIFAAILAGASVVLFVLVRKIVAMMHGVK